MTGQCYYCAAEEHFECHGEGCTCCRERNRRHKEQVREAVQIRADLARKRRSR
jgi:hypothetical protein